MYDCDTIRAPGMDESQSTSPKGEGDEEARMPLSTVVRVKEVFVRKGREWGFVLRGTTTQFGSLSLRVYTCSIDSITKGGPAEVSCCLRGCGSRKRVSAQCHMGVRTVYGLFACYGFTFYSWNVNSSSAFQSLIAYIGRLWYGSVGSRALFNEYTHSSECPLLTTRAFLHFCLVIPRRRPLCHNSHHVFVPATVQA